MAGLSGFFLVWVSKMDFWFLTWKYPSRQCLYGWRLEWDRSRRWKKFFLDISGYVWVCVFMKFVLISDNKISFNFILKYEYFSRSVKKGAFYVIFMHKKAVTLNGDDSLFFVEAHKLNYPLQNSVTSTYISQHT